MIKKFAKINVYNYVLDVSYEFSESLSENLLLSIELNGIDIYDLLSDDVVNIVERKLKTI